MAAKTMFDLFVVTYNRIDDKISMTCYASFSLVSHPGHGLY